LRSLSAVALTTPALQLRGLRLSLAGRWVGVLVLLAFILRLVWLLYVDTIPLGGDPHWYYVVAINLANGDGFVTAYDPVLSEIPGPGNPTAFWPPGYPLALAGAFKIVGTGVTTGQVLNAMLAAATVPFVYLFGRALLPRGPALVAAGIFAVYPNVIAGVPLLFPEPLFTLLFFAALWLLTMRGGWQTMAAFGALTGLACLTRGQGAVLIPIALVYIWAREGWRASAGATIIASVTALIVLAPWTVRNTIQMDAFIPISTNSGAALRVGHGPESIGTTKWTQDRVDGFYMWESMRNPEWEVRGYREYTRLAIEYALTHPVRELELTKLKLYNLYRSDADIMPWLTTLGTTPLEPPGMEGALRRMFDASYYVLFFGAVLCVPFWLQRRAEVVLLGALFFFWTLFHVVFLAEPRYHVPLYPAFFIIVAGGGWLVIMQVGRLLSRPR
jgi:4-amino-4-deoxy-L-arabinose transferase-like glycosyltransferase